MFLSKKLVNCNNYHDGLLNIYEKKLNKAYTTDGKVKTFSSEEDINSKLGKILEKIY